MSQHDPQTLRRELLIEEGINQQMDALVRLANQNAALLEQNPRMEESQLRNLLSVSIESRSVEVVLNYIRYQIGRSSNAWGPGQNDFGHVVITTIQEQISFLAKKVISFAAERITTDKQAQAAEHKLLEEQYFKSSYIRLVQLFLGYLQRAFYYGKKTTGGFRHLIEISKNVAGEPQ